MSAQGQGNFTCVWGKRDQLNLHPGKEIRKQYVKKYIKLKSYVIGDN